MRNSTIELLKKAKQENQDFEWYPTTQEIIDAIVQRIGNYDLDIMDVGAGDGRVLNALSQSRKGVKLYAIEKSKTLLSALPKNIFVIGTDFHEQTLIDKRVDLIFSNPPYSEFEVWAEKIITEAQARIIYLVMPRRWAGSERIGDAIKMRKAKHEVVLTTDFLSADRQARVEVDVVEVVLTSGRFSRYGNNFDMAVDPFSLWFDQCFPLKQDEGENSSPLSGFKEEVANEVALTGDLVSTLERFYQRDLSRLLDAYKAVSVLEPSILRELDVNKDALIGGLKKKAEGLKDKYWKLLFDNMERVTNRLTSQSRNELFSVLTKNTHVDFTRSNAYAVLEWVVKNANQYYGEQLIDVYELMVEKANVTLYKSNQRVFRDDDWRYCRKPEELSHFKLDYRIILTRLGGLDVTYSWTRGKLAARASAFLDDLCTVAYNLGFDTWGTDRSAGFTWTSGSKAEFRYRDLETGELRVLFDVKAYQNGNMHIRLCPMFICKLNVEFGRLKGWLKTKEQACGELDAPLSDVSDSFMSNKQINFQQEFLLTFNQAA